MFVPILHSYCHNFKCRTRYCPRNIFGIGLEDGENAERFWSRLGWNVHHRYMRPENRRDFLTAHVNLMCTKSFKQLSKTLRLKLRNAKNEASCLLKNIANVGLYFEVKRYTDFENNRVSSVNTFEDWPSDRLLAQIYDTASTLQRLQILQRERKGAKSTAMLARTIQSTSKSLTDYVSMYNLKHCVKSEETITESDVLERIKDPLHKTDHIKKILFWKSIEQIIMTRRDIDDAIKSIQLLSTKLARIIEDCRTRELFLVDLHEQKQQLFKSTLQSLKKIEDETADIDWENQFNPFLRQIQDL